MLHILEFQRTGEYLFDFICFLQIGKKKKLKVDIHYFLFKVSFRGHSQRTSGQNRDFQTPPPRLSGVVLMSPKTPLPSPSTDVRNFYNNKIFHRHRDTNPHPQTPKQTHGYTDTHKHTHTCINGWNICFYGKNNVSSF